MSSTNSENLGSKTIDISHLQLCGVKRRRRYSEAALQKKREMLAKVHAYRGSGCMTHSSEQIRQSLANPLEKPLNSVPVTQQVLKNDKPAEAGLQCPVAGLHNGGRYGCR